MSEKVYSLDEIRSIAAPIAARHGVAALYLFGSYARGEATENSVRAELRNLGHNLSEAVYSSFSGAVCLTYAGVVAERIADLDACTVCNNQEFFSYRAQDGVCGRHGAFAVRMD